MPKFCEEHVGTAARELAVRPRPWAPGFDPAVVARAERLELWCQGEGDDASDIYDEWRLYDAAGATLARTRVRF